MNNNRPMSSIIVIGILVILISIVLFSCNNGNQYNKKMKEMLESFRQVEFPGLNKEQREQWLFYKAIYRKEPNTVQAFLNKGFNPNYCHGECGWADSNPLAVVAESIYDTYNRCSRGEEIPDPVPDVATLQVLVAGGADVNWRPYIWNRVYGFNNEDLNAYWKMDSVKVSSVIAKEDYKIFCVKDLNRIIEAFLKAGADPDMLGHP